MTELIEAVNAIRNVPHYLSRAHVKRVAVILSAPRSGSTLLKSILGAHPDIASLDGESEPFLALTLNGFGYNSDSDAIDVLANDDRLADNLIDDLTVPAEVIPAPDWHKQRWMKRLILQFPCLFSQERRHQELIRSLGEALGEITSGHAHEARGFQRHILDRVFRHERWRINFYDGHLDARSNVVFNEPAKIEEPPFVLPRVYRRSFTEDDAVTKTLLFKAPSDVYRLGMYERLFPRASVRYIHLTRGYAQSVNGLMDGWLSPIGFFSHDLARSGVGLNIRGYSDAVSFGRTWWKFGLPPDWRAFTDADLETVCLHQWSSAHTTILASRIPMLRVALETFLTTPSAVAKSITDYLDLPEFTLQPKLPVMMAIEPPKLKRWKKREASLLEMAKTRHVAELMESLRYTMDPETWL
jgi:hypothetical protein